MIQHKTFKPISEFNVEIPEDLSLDSISKKKYLYWNQNITDANFRTNLVKGKEYIAEIYQLEEDMSSEDIVALAEKENRILPGALGGVTLTSHYGEKLPKDRWVVCLDKPENLWRDAGDLMVMDFLWGGGGWRFDLTWWDGGWDWGYSIVFFRECELGNLDTGESSELGYLESRIFALEDWKQKVEKILRIP